MSRKQNDAKNNFGRNDAKSNLVFSSIVDLIYCIRVNSVITIDNILSSQKVRKLMLYEQLLYSCGLSDKVPSRDAEEYKRRYALDYARYISKMKQKDFELNLDEVKNLISYSLGTYFASEFFCPEMTERMLWVVENSNNPKFNEQQLLDALINYKEKIPERSGIDK